VFQAEFGLLPGLSRFGARSFFLALLAQQDRELVAWRGWLASTRPSLGVPMTTGSGERNIPHRVDCRRAGRGKKDTSFPAQTSLRKSRKLVCDPAPVGWDRARINDGGGAAAR
jgi:hypothetical protein